MAMKKNRKSIYLDYAATTPVNEDVFLKMKNFFSFDFGNPGSIHNSGVKAMASVEMARREVAKILGAKASEVVFTSGGTESDNMAILGVANFFKRVGRGKRLHIITTKIEHHAVLKPVKFLELNGFDVTYIPISEKGVVRLDDVKNAIRENTVLVSIMYANNEVGTIQPIREIGNFLKKYRGDRQYPVFHTDACQAAGSLSLQVSNLGVDLLTLSASKFYGPKGSGILYVRKNTSIDPIMFGGEQEGGMRSGTQNVPAIIGLAEALKIADKKRIKEVERLVKLRDYFISSVKKNIDGSRLNGDIKMRLPNNVNLYFPGIPGERLVIELDVLGVECSTGSACSSREDAPSHVLMSLFNDKQRTMSSVRFTLGRSTNKKEIDYVVKVLKEIIFRLKKIQNLNIDESKLID